MKRNLMKEAHKLTKQIVSEYGDVDYRTQLSLCLSFLSQEEEEEEMVELKGTEKQVKYALDLIKNMKKENASYYERKLEGRNDSYTEKVKLRMETAENYILSLDKSSIIIKNLLYYNGGGTGMVRLGKALLEGYKVKENGLVVIKK